MKSRRHGPSDAIHNPSQPLKVRKTLDMSQNSLAGDTTLKDGGEAQTITNDAGTSTTLIPCHVTTKDKTQKKIDVKARSMLLLNTHVVVWRNKSNLDTMIIDDLYNNFKIVKQEVKGIAFSYSSSQNMAFISSPSLGSTNQVPTAYEVSTASTQSSTTSTKVGTTNLSNATVVLQLPQDETFFKRMQTARNQDSRSWNQDSSRRTVSIEDTTPKAMGAIDGITFDWSYTAKDEVSTNMALIALSDSQEFKQPDFLCYRPKSCETESKNASKEILNELKESLDAPLVKDRVSDNKDCSVESLILVEKKTDVPTVIKYEFIKAKQQKSQPRAVNTVRPRPVNTARPNLTVVNAVRVNQVQVNDGLGPQRKLISLFYMQGHPQRMNLMEDMLPLEEEQMVAELLRNKFDLDTMSINDLYNNFKIVKQELVNEDLEQLHEDNLEEMDLKWQLALLSMSAKRQSRNQDSRSWNQYSFRRTVNVEDTPPKAMVAIDGVGFDWSYMAEDESYETESKNASKEILNELKESPTAPLVKDMVSDNKDCSVESPVVVEKKSVVLTVTKVEFVKARQQGKPVRKPIKYAEMYKL
nr:hypothetical protein [Tanacetum cinerariifolium]